MNKEKILSKGYRKHINLDEVLAFNFVRSYREGNIGHLNFVVVDNRKMPIFSFNLEINHLSNGEYNGFSNAVEDTRTISYKLFTCAQNGNWFPSYDVYKLQELFIDEDSVKIFLNVISSKMHKQLKEYLDVLDFFSLQTKEDYLIDYHEIEKYIFDIKKTYMQYLEEQNYFMIDRIFDFITSSQVVVLDDCDKDTLKKWKSKGAYMVWLMERQKEMIITYNNEELSVLQNVNIKY